VNSKDEIGVLAEAFNSMSVSLDQSQSLRRQMTADIAHDLRTPLTVLQGYLEAMSSRDLEPTQERIELLYAEAKHLGRLVEDLRVLSLADAGELPLNVGLVRCRDLLDSVQAFLSREAKSRGIKLEVEPEIDPIQLEVDPDHMKRVLINLVSNAIHHTSSGGTITISATRATGSSGHQLDAGNVPASPLPGSTALNGLSRADDRRVYLRVTDTGEGIAEADVPNVFERFYRSDTARHRTGSGGSGLGLAICKALVEAQGGKIRVEKTGPDGTTMRIDLPAAA
jgi:signal transduction histidine kinase